jgi:hypothetical protein
MKCVDVQMQLARGLAAHGKLQVKNTTFDSGAGGPSDATNDFEEAYEPQR